VFCLRHTGQRGLRFEGLGELNPAIMGIDALRLDNLKQARKALESHFDARAKDAIVFVQPDGAVPTDEFELMLRRHEDAMGLSPKRIFLSHKGADKPFVRSVKETLQLLGFDPWLDDDAMAVGTSLERGISSGFENSCAAVFFITPNFKDEAYLATEVEYAIREKRKDEAFAIISLVFRADGHKGTVPTLLQGYVWKDVKSELQALREIIRALPIAVGQTHWR
jgi:hypothetical protein